MIKYIFESDDFDNNITYQKLYPDENEDDKIIFRNNLNIFYNFLNNGYAAANAGKFAGFMSHKDFKHKCNLAYAAYYNDKLIALSVHSNYLNGYKCVGMTITTNQDYHDYAIVALYHMIQDFTDNWSDWVWAETSDAIEHMFSKCGATPMPVQFVPLMITKNITELNDGYHYKRELSVYFYEDEKFIQKDVTKIIFGFSSQDIYNKYIDYINNHIHDDNNVNESYEDDSVYYLGFGKEIGLAYRKLLSYHELFIYNYIFDVPQEFINDIKHNKRKIERYIESKFLIDKRKKKMLLNIIEDADLMLSILTPMNPPKHFIESLKSNGFFDVNY